METKVGHCDFVNKRLHKCVSNKDNNNKLKIAITAPTLGQLKLLMQKSILMEFVVSGRTSQRLVTAQCVSCQVWRRFMLMSVCRRES